MHVGWRVGSVVGIGPDGGRRLIWRRKGITVSRSTVFDLLDREWQQVASSTSARHALTAWSESVPGLAPYRDLATVADACRRAAPQDADRLLHDLVALTLAGDRLAGRVVLQLLLPGCVALYRRLDWLIPEHVRDDAMYRLGDTYWLRVPLGKLHNDRSVPLHPLLIGLINDYRAWRGPTPTGLLVERDDHRSFDRRTIHRYVLAVAKRAGVGHVIPISCATRSPPKPSTGACVSRPSLRCWAIMRVIESSGCF